jgi:hypothetical protein
MQIYVIFVKEEMMIINVILFFIMLVQDMHHATQFLLRIFICFSGKDVF